MGQSPPSRTLSSALVHSQNPRPESDQTKMPPKSETLPPPTATTATLSDPSSGSIDPIVHVIQIRPVVFLPGRVNGQYIIEGLSSGFMFVLGGVGIVLMDLAKSVKVSYATAGISSIVLAYVMSKDRLV